MKTVFLGIASLICIITTHGQWHDSLNIQMGHYAFKKRSDLLFVHTDKHIYTNNELIWFSAYLLRCAQDSLPLHRFLNVMLVHTDLRTPVIQQKFLMAGGRSYGSLTLPDSIAPGEYKLVAGTNIIDQDSLPVALFTQEISVKSLLQPELVVTMDIPADSLQGKDLVVTVRQKADYRPVRDAHVWLWTSDGKSIPGKTDGKGQYRQNISAFTPGSTIGVRVKYKSDIMFLQKQLPEVTTVSELHCRFYPEGGYLLPLAPCRVGWESATSQGEPMAVRAALFKNGMPVDSIDTDNAGLGVFTLLPEATAQYSVRVLQMPPGVRPAKEEYTLPAVASTGVTINMPHAIAGDSLPFRIYAAGHSRIRMVVHNFRTVFETSDLSTKQDGLQVLLLLHAIPKGLAAVTLLDSANRPLAERIFFAHYNVNTTVSITTGKKVFEKREKVTLQFQLNSNQVPAPGIASVSCAQENRFNSSKHQDITSFTFLLSELHNWPAYITGKGYNDGQYLETVLLVKGWRRYSWNELTATPASPPVFSSPVFSGKVLRAYGKIKKPVNVTVLNGNASVSMITTRDNGDFEFTYDDLSVAQDKKLWISASSKRDIDNYVAIIDPFIGINKKVAASFPFRTGATGKFLQYAPEPEFKEFARARQLATVTVTAKKNVAIYKTANACGDYVCRYNVLNCRNHVFELDNRAPVKGQSYSYFGGGIVYAGCSLEEKYQPEHLLQYDGIKTAKEFYGEDLSAKATGMPEYISTIYWSPALVFDANGQASCSFYTSDIAGQFRITVNGITDNDLFFATELFEVK